MPFSARNISLPIEMPTQNLLREAARNIIMDLQKATGETDPEMAEKIGVSPTTIAKARLDSLPVLVAAQEALSDYVAAIQRWRLAA